jgi:uncharacterized protein (TIGR02217 family)
MPTGFHEVQFPSDFALGARGGPQFNTTVVESGGGFEQRNINWAQARGRWTVGFNIKTRTQMNVLINFYRARFGRAYGFRFKDWADYQATAQLAAAVTGTTFQMYKLYTDAIGQTYNRKISKPVNGSVHVFINAVEQMSGWTVDYTTGIISIPAFTSGTVTATFEFDVPVRFDTDHMDVEVPHYEILNWEGVPIVELKL